MTHKSGRLALIDAAIILYAACASVEESIDWGDGSVTENVGNFDDVCDQIVAKVVAYRDAVGATEVVLGISCDRKSCWRRDVLPSYKNNRETRVDPYWRPQAKAFVRENYNVLQRPGLEADDVLGIAATRARWHEIPPSNRIIVSQDKDFLQIPTSVYNPRTEVEWKRSLRDADAWHMYQTMVGDACDGYTGIPRVGPVKAERMLAAALRDDNSYDMAALWRAMVHLADSKGMTEDELLVQARVARILRDEDYHKGEVKLWTPPR